MSAKYSAKISSTVQKRTVQNGHFGTAAARGRTTGRCNTRWPRRSGKRSGINEATADVAIAYAVEKGWLIAEGNPPHSVSLIYGWGEE
jgi:hypothetical protein